MTTRETKCRTGLGNIEKDTRSLVHALDTSIEAAKRLCAELESLRAAAMDLLDNWPNGVDVLPPLEVLQKCLEQRA